MDWRQSKLREGTGREQSTNGGVWWGKSAKEGIQSITKCEHRDVAGNGHYCSQT